MITQIFPMSWQFLATLYFCYNLFQFYTIIRLLSFENIINLLLRIVLYLLFYYLYQILSCNNRIYLTVFSDTMDVKMRQGFILKLLNHIMEPVMYKEIEELGKNYKIEENIHLYTVSY